MAKTKKATRRPAIRSRDGRRDVRIVEYEITWEPIQDLRFKRLPGQVKDAVERLYQESRRHPRRAIPELLDLLKKYPKIPRLYNYLSIAYSHAGQREKAEEAIQENYRRNPDYLFARLNYAELFLRQGNYGQIAEIFEHKFDLKLLYPNRKRFHISEVASFMALIGIYFFETGEREGAERYCEILKEIAPSYPMAKMLRGSYIRVFWCGCCAVWQVKHRHGLCAFFDWLESGVMKIIRIM